MFKEKVSKVILSLLVLSILLTSVFAGDFFSEGIINYLLMEKDFLIIHLLILMNMTI